MLTNPELKALWSIAFRNIVPRRMETALKSLQRKGHLTAARTLTDSGRKELLRAAY